MKTLFGILRPGQVFFFNGISYTKLTTNLTTDQLERCNVAKNSKINAVKTDKTNGIWLEQQQEVEIELK